MLAILGLLMLSDAKPKLAISIEVVFRHIAGIPKGCRGLNKHGRREAEEQGLGQTFVMLQK